MSKQLTPQQEAERRFPYDETKTYPNGELDVHFKNATDREREIFISGAQWATEQIVIEMGNQYISETLKPKE